MLLSLVFAVAMSWADDSRPQTDQPFYYSEPVVGFLKQDGSKVIVDAADKRYYVKKADFMALNKVGKDSGKMASHYLIPTDSITKVEFKAAEHFQ